jgi:hypothetical protein
MKFIKILICGLLLAASNAWAAFDTASAYVVVKSTDGTIYYLQQGAYYQAVSPYTAVSSAIVGALTNQFSAVSPGSGGGGGGAITAAASSYSAGAGVDGWDLTQGAKADAACASSGSTCSVISILKALLVANVQLPTSSTVASGTLTNVAASATSVTCLASNAARLRGIIYNDSTSATLYIKAGTTASTSSFTWLLLPGASLVLDSFPVYTGKLDCIWSAAVGNARVTEF